MMDTIENIISTKVTVLLSGYPLKSLLILPELVLSVIGPNKLSFTIFPT